MENNILKHNIWQKITDATVSTKQKCYVAVAYFGTGGANLLPLPPGSKLVVDVSKAAVGSGQTNPMELLSLLKNGVEIYSYEELHAKVFVIGSRLFIGSNNVSGRSAERLQEATFSTTERSVVHEGRDFVKGLCIPQLRMNRSTLKDLCTHYKSPRVPQAKEVTKRERIRAWVMHTKPYDIPDYAVPAINSGKQKLKDKTYRISGAKADYLYWEGRLPMREKDIFFCVHHTGRNKELFSEAVMLFAEGVKDTNEHVVFYSTDRQRPRSFSNLNLAAKRILNSTKTLSFISRTKLNMLRQR